MIEINDSSELSLRCRSVLSTMFDGKMKCHQNYRVIEYLPQARSELSPTMDAVGVLGMRCAISVSNLIPESGLSATKRKI